MSHSKVLRSVSPVRDLGRQELIEFRIGAMRLDHGFNDGADQIVERRSGMPQPTHHLRVAAYSYRALSLTPSPRAYASNLIKIAVAAEHFCQELRIQGGVNSLASNTLFVGMVLEKAQGHATACG